ncbi:Protein of unknown function [Lactobacillus delbrueckii subsp. lactis]|nr:Protein of unknown function [Lactobacillus delbrueckii subsp. lactis]CDR82534.1 Protein of unknown function [Lactobacillus delbrueckii subsp. lactis]
MLIADAEKRAKLQSEEAAR